MDLVRRWSVQW